MPKKYVCSDPNRPICKQGLLRKKGGSHGGFQTWNSRYFVIDFEHLAYYKSKKAYFDNATPIRIIPRKQLSAVPAAPKQHIFGGSTDCQFELVTTELSPQGVREIRVLLDAGTLENRNEWVGVINFVHAITPLAGFPSISLDDVAARKVSLFTQRAHDVLKTQFFLPPYRDNSPLGQALSQPLDVKAPKDLGCRSLADFFEYLRKRATEELSSGAYNTPLPPSEPSPVSRTAALHQSNSSFSTKTSPKLRKYHSSRPDALHASDTEIVLSEDSSYGEASDDNLSQDGKFYEQEPGLPNPLYSFSQPGEKKHHRSPSARSHSKEKKKKKQQQEALEEDNTTLDLADEKTLFVDDLPPSARSSVSSLPMASRVFSERNASHTRLNSAQLPSQGSQRKHSATKKYDSKTLSADLARVVALRAKTEQQQPAHHRSLGSSGSGGRPSHSPVNSQVILGNFLSDVQPSHRRANSFQTSPGHSVSAEQRSGNSSLRSTPSRADVYRVRDSAPLLLSQVRNSQAAVTEMDPEFAAPMSPPPSPPPPPPPFYESESDVPLPPPTTPLPKHTPLSPIHDYESSARSSRSSKVARIQMMSQTLPTPLKAVQVSVPQYAEPAMHTERMYSNSTVISSSEYEPYKADRSRSSSRFSMTSSRAPSNSVRGKPRYSTATLPRQLSRTLSANSQRSLANYEAALGHRPASPTISQPDITDFEDMGGAPRNHHYIELDGISSVPLPPPPSMTPSRAYHGAEMSDELAHKLRSRAKLFA